MPKRTGHGLFQGLYPESHGIVSNSFLSEDRSDYFRIGSKTSLNSKWWKGEPVSFWHSPCDLLTSDANRITDRFSDFCFQNCYSGLVHKVFHDALLMISIDFCDVITLVLYKVLDHAFFPKMNIPQ